MIPGQNRREVTGGRSTRISTVWRGGMYNIKRHPAYGYILSIEYCGNKIELAGEDYSELYQKMGRLLHVLGGVHDTIGYERIYVEHVDTAPDIDLDLSNTNETKYLDSPQPGSTTSTGSGYTEQSDKYIQGI